MRHLIILNVLLVTNLLFTTAVPIQGLVKLFTKVLARVEQLHEGDSELIKTFNSNYNECKDLLFYLFQMAEV